MRMTLRVKFTFSYSQDLVFGVVSGAELTEDSSCCGIVAGELGWSWPCQRNMCCRAEDEPKKIEDSHQR